MMFSTVSVIGRDRQTHTLEVHAASVSLERKIMSRLWLVIAGVALTAAPAEHVDPEYRASALYERSKSLYHLAKLVPSDEGTRTACIAAAEEACLLSEEKKFWTWREHIGAWPPSGSQAALA